jgi:hypothetical protein
MLSEKDGKIRGWRKYIEGIENVRGMASMVGRVVDNMKQDIAAGHGSPTTANELKVNNFTQLSVGY